MQVPDKVTEALLSARCPIVIGHVTPDIDALASMLSVVRAMPSGDVAVVLAGTPITQKMRFLLDLAGPVAMADEDRVACADVAVIVDTAATNRVNVPGGWDTIAEKLVINIDHHITNPDYGQVNWVADEASSTSEMVCCLIRSAGWPLDAATSTLLYAGIYADTAAFSLPNATADAFDTAAGLVRLGADVEAVGLRLCRSQQQHEFDLVRTVYHNTRVAGDGHIAYSTLTHREIAAAGCTPQDIDDQVSIPRSLSGIRIAMLFSEGEPGVIRINLRGENGTKVLPVAERLGGGGHMFSAGVRIRGEMSDVVSRVLAEAVKALHVDECGHSDVAKG